jgi:multiple sugar transport system permease protein
MQLSQHSRSRSRRRARTTSVSARADGFWPWLFVMPFFAGLLAFSVWPTFRTLAQSFTKSGPFGGSQQWVGLQNFDRLFGDPHLYRALLNTCLFTALLMLSIPIALFLASLINRPGIRGAGVYRVIYFMPYVTMPTAIALVWKLIFNGDHGVLNWILSLVGIDGPYWVSTPWYSIIAVSIVGIWMSVGFNMIIFLAGMQNIPREVYEAAQMDGASNWRQFLSITVPLLVPTTFFVSIVTLIAGLQLFDLLFALVGPTNPAMRESESLTYMFYNQAFGLHDSGYAAAVAILILFVTSVVTAVQFWLRNAKVRDVSY